MVWELFQPAAVDRVPLREGYGLLDLQPPRSPRHRPVWRGTTNKLVGVYEEEFPTWEGPVTDSGYRKPALLPSIGGAEGTGGGYPS